MFTGYSVGWGDGGLVSLCRKQCLAANILQEEATFCWSLQTLHSFINTQTPEETFAISLEPGHMVMVVLMSKAHLFSTFLTQGFLGSLHM